MDTNLGEAFITSYKKNRLQNHIKSKMMKDESLEVHEWSFIVGQQTSALENIYDRLRILIESKEFDFDNNPHATFLNEIKDEIGHIAKMMPCII